MYSQRPTSRYSGSRRLFIRPRADARHLARRWPRTLLLWLPFAFLAVSACGIEQATLVPSNTPRPTTTATLVPTTHPAPSALPSATPSALATVTSSPTPTPAPTSTNTLTATSTQRPTPSPAPADTPIPRTPSKTVTLYTPDGYALAGQLYWPEGQGPFPAVVLSHMGGASKETWANLPELLQQAGYIVLIFDFRGHGESAGRLDPPSAVVDLTAALAYLQASSQVDEERIGLVGASMGGMASVIVGAADPTVRTVVAISTSPSAAGQFPGQVIHQLSPRPFLAIGCHQDPLTRPERVNELYEAAAEPKRIVMLDCAAHGNDILTTEASTQLLALVLGWLDSHIQGEP